MQRLQKSKKLHNAQFFAKCLNNMELMNKHHHWNVVRIVT